MPCPDSPFRLSRAFLLGLLMLLTACAGPQVPVETKLPPKPAATLRTPKIAIALGGGAARGFAHIGVIKALEAQGIVPDYVAGTSAGSVVASLYAGGYSGFELQKIGIDLEQAAVGDLVMPDRGFVKGELLQDFINKALQNRPMEKLPRPLAVVATDLQSGEPVVFRRGNVGMAVRASSSIPGVFQPIRISGREYVDGGLVSPVPVKAARAMGADVVIAVDISAKPRYGRVASTLDILLQTFSIMGQSISEYELAGADVVIRPETGAIGMADFDSRHRAILEGERAAQAALPLIREKLRKSAERTADALR